MVLSAFNSFNSFNAKPLNGSRVSAESKKEVGGKSVMKREQEEKKIRSSPLRFSV